MVSHLRSSCLNKYDRLEFDFKHEAAMTELRIVLQHRAGALVPAVIEELSTEHQIVMEFPEKLCWFCDLKIYSCEGIVRPDYWWPIRSNC